MQTNAEPVPEDGAAGWGDSEEGGQQGPTRTDEHPQPQLIVSTISLFPNIFESWLAQGVVSRTRERGIVDVQLIDLRPFGVGRHQVTDDYPFGGGAGMVMKPEPLFAAVESLDLPSDTPIILLSPRGRPFTQHIAHELAAQSRLVFVCGHYEGIDERVVQHLITDEISIGDYVLSAGELAAMVVIDAVVRLLPGALSAGSTEDESFSQGLLEYPQYTRPATFREWSVPDVLLSGHHAEIARWRREQSLVLTRARRPDLLASVELSDRDREVLEAHATPPRQDADLQPD